MSLLNNNKKALELVSAMSAGQLADKLGAREHVNGYVAAAIRNTDTERRKEALLQKNPAGIVAALKALTLLSGAKGAIIVSPLEGVEDARRHVFSDFMGDDPLPANFRKALDGETTVTGIVAEGDGEDREEVEIVLAPNLHGHKVHGVVGSLLQRV